MEHAPFLKQVAEQLWQQYGDKLETLTIVLPTRRTRLYFAQYLSSVIDKPVWQPRYMGMEELLASQSLLKMADKYRLLVELYKVYSKHRQSEETFDHFYFWGEAMLNDFDTIDKYRVNAQSLFTNLADQKELEGDYSFLEEHQVELIQRFWESFSPHKESRLQASFVEIWDVLYPIYHDFRKVLAAKGIAYEGMVMRLLADELEKPNFAGFEGTFVFAGFNALNECEKSLMRYLKTQGQALFYWDYDEYYSKNPIQESGMFISENLINFPPEQLPDSFTSFSTPKSIEVISATNDVMQAKLVPLLLDELQAGTTSAANHTAIVPIDEKLLIPLLYSLPESMPVNVTMGYPLSQTPVSSLAELLIKLQRGKKKSGKSSCAFYHKDIQAVLNHPYIKRLSGAEGEEILKHIVTYNRVYVSSKLIVKNELLELLFSSPDSYMEMADYLTNVISIVAQADLDDEAALRKEYAYHFVSSLRQLKKAISDEGMELEMPVFLSLLRMAIRGIRIPFNGEPLQGVQVMGILETRALDFENVIMLSINEGKLPQTSVSLSFIPYNLRKGFGIPAHEQHEAIYAYYFYRTIQRAKNIRLLYSSKAEDGSSGEMSRYLQQLKIESGHNVVERMVTYKIAKELHQTFSATKTEKVMQQLTEQAANGLSPSAISTLIACPMQFYFKYVCKLKEDDEVEEDVSMRSFGNILHSAIEQLYRPYVGNSLNAEAIKTIYYNEQLVKQHVDTAFAQAYFHSDTLPDDFEQNGKLAIVRDIVLKYVKGILQFDMKKAPFTVLLLEKKLQTPFHVTVNGTEYELYLKGIIDRVDEVNGAIHIVDYKTGRSKREFKGVEALFSDLSDQQNNAVLQTFTYSLMYENELGTTKPLTPTLYFVRDIFSSNFSNLMLERVGRAETVTVNSFSAYREDFTKLLRLRLQSLMDIHEPFKQADDVKVCSYCHFNKLCGR